MIQWFKKLVTTHDGMKANTKKIAAQKNDNKMKTIKVKWSESDKQKNERNYNSKNLFWKHRK
jgi:hypothetical protein